MSENEVNYDARPEATNTDNKNLIHLPSRKRIIEVMAQRGYSLVHESPDFKLLQFAELKHPSDLTNLNVTVFADKNAFTFFTVINPGIVKLSTDVFTDIEDDNLFKELETHIKATLASIYDQD